MSRTVAPQDGIGARFLNVEWKLGPTRDWRNVVVLALTDAARVSGFAVFLRQERPLVFRFGEIKVATAPLTRLTLIGDAYISPDVDADARQPIAADFLRTLRGHLGGSEAAYFEGLPVDGTIHQLLAQASNQDFITIRAGENFDHQFIKLPGTFAEYVKGLGSRSRQSVQYSVRRLEKDMEGKVELVRFDDEQRADEFLRHAAQISSKTYQTNLLGLGIHDDEATANEFRFAARNGWFRSYILYCRGVPSAFMLGHVYQGCYYYDDVGYDPEYAKWSVGSVLQLKMLEELIGSEDRTGFLDFSTGYGSHKGRFGNFSRTEANVLALPVSLKNKLLSASYRATASTSDAVVELLQKLGVKDRIKKAIRQVWRR